MIRQARELDLLTCAYVFNPREAEQMATAGADIVVAHMGLTTKGMIGAQTALTLQECCGRIQAMHDAAKRINPAILVLCHGGPISEPEDAAIVLAGTEGVAGFFGASSIERIPAERAITAQVEAFKSIPVGRQVAHQTAETREAHAPRVDVSPFTTEHAALSSAADGRTAPAGHGRDEK